MGKSTSIPEPPGLPFLGNLFDIDMELPLKSLFELAEKHGKSTWVPLPSLGNTD
jgi:cytochrome P450/NADPH-cytochrome P450 reductase